MKTNPQIDEKNWEILARSVYDHDADVPADELELAQKSVFSSESESKRFHRLIKMVDQYFHLKKYPADDAWKKVEARIQHTGKTGRSVWMKVIVSPAYRAVAAVLVVAFLLVAGYQVFYIRSGATALQEIKAGDQALQPFTLPDGTLVSLNSQTHLSYPEKFSDKLREVTIEGEAFFEVKPDKNKPFVIHAGNARIKVLGTSFSVSAYPDSKQVEVIVQTGKVQVVNKMAETAQPNELILDPGDKGTLIYASNSMRKSTNQDPNFIAWKTHNLIFRATSLIDVTRSLENVYKVKINLADPKLNNLLLTAQFNDYPLDFILKVIENTFHLEVQQENGQYVLKERS